MTWPFERPVEVKGELAKILVVADNAVVAAVAEAVQGSILLDNVPNNLALMTPQLNRIYVYIHFYGFKFTSPWKENIYFIQTVIWNRHTTQLLTL